MSRRALSHSTGGFVQGGNGGESRMLCPAVMAGQYWLVMVRI
jgi:hypothetical protein